MFKRYSITDERDLTEAMMKRAAYEATLPKAETTAKVRRSPKKRVRP